MILTRTPLRISIGGGGTDLPSYYRRQGGTVISAAIDKYVYLAVNATFTQRLPAQVLDARAGRAHRGHRPRADPRSARPLRRRRRASRSSASPTSRPAPVSARRARSPSACSARCTRTATSSARPQALAEEACHIEIERLADPVGKQDQYIAAFGGLTRFEFRADDTVDVERLDCQRRDPRRPRGPPAPVLHRLLARARPASSPTRSSAPSSDDAAMIANLDYVNELGRRIGAALESGDTAKFAALMHEHWMHKRKRSDGHHEPADRRVVRGRRERTARVGGKLVGAGAGGFLLFYAEDPRRVRARDGRRRAARGALRLRPRRLRRAGTELMPLPCLVLGGGLGHADAPRDRHARRSRCSASRASRSRCTSCAGSRREGVTDVVYSIGYLGAHDPRRARRARRSRLHGALRRRGRDTARHRRRGAARGRRGRARRRRSSCSTGTRTSGSTSAAVASDFERSGAEALMTVFRNDGRLGREQRRVRRAPGRAVRQAASPIRRRPGCTTSTTVCRSCGARRCRARIPSGAAERPRRPVATR